MVRALGELGDAKARGSLHRQLDRELDGRVRRRIREVLRDLGGTGKRETDRLRDELEVLRSEHSELKARVGKIEAASKPAEPAARSAARPAAKPAAKPEAAAKKLQVKRGKKK